MSRRIRIFKAGRVFLYVTLSVFALFPAAEFGVRILYFVKTNDTRFLLFTPN